MQRFSNIISNKKIFNLIGSPNNIQKAIYDITLHLYSDDVKYKISKKSINGFTVRFSDKNYKEIVDAYTKEKDNWAVLINNCYNISCNEIKDLNKYINNFSDGKIETHNLFVYPNHMNKIEDSCINITCKCKKDESLNMKEYYLSEKHDFCKKFVKNLLYDKHIQNESSVLFLPSSSSSSSSTKKTNTLVYFQPDI